MMSGLGSATSGLKAAQAGLYVTGHNMSNVDTRGYSRQSALQQDFLSSTVGVGGNSIMQVGLGTDISQIRQIRDIFLDRTYRTEVSRGNFYSSKYETGLEIETIIGELQSDYKTQSVMQDLWDSLNELSIHPEGLETRGSFVSTAVKFLDKINNIASRLSKEQDSLNEQVKTSVTRINQLTTEIEKYNRLIVSTETSGEHANDFRDSRNLCLDELSELVDITYKENKYGSVDVLLGGNELVLNGVVTQVGLRQSAKGSSFVEPVFTKSPTVLDFDPTGQNAKALFKLEGKISNLLDNDKGKLKGLLVARGTHPANYSTNPQVGDPNYEKELFNVTQCTIPKVQKELDTLVNKIITMINDEVSPLLAGPPRKKDPNGPVGLDKSQHTEIFVRKNLSRFDAAGNYNEEDPTDIFSLYSMGNVTINPLLLDSGGFNKIAISRSGDVADCKVITDILSKWKAKTVQVDGSEPLSIDDFYVGFVVKSAVVTDEARRFVEEQQILVSQADNKRSQFSGVSLDEEMRNMMIFQHAYNASAKVVNQIDSMIDRIINQTGRVGR